MRFNFFLTDLHGCLLISFPKFCGNCFQKAQQTSSISLTSTVKSLFSAAGLKVHMNSCKLFNLTDTFARVSLPTIPLRPVTKTSLAKIGHGNGNNRKNSCQNNRTLLLLACKTSENITSLNSFPCNDTGTTLFPINKTLLYFLTPEYSCC